MMVEASIPVGLDGPAVRNGDLTATEVIMGTAQEQQLVTRTLKVSEMVCPECDAIIVEALSAMNGVLQVKADWRTNQVHVTYDFPMVRIQDVEKILTEIGYPPDSGILHGWKRGWLHFTEQNAIDHLKHVAPCCNKPPPAR